MSRPSGRLRALEAKITKDGSVLTESQLEGEGPQKAHGESTSEHPGYCLAQDTFYVGTLKGVGRVYQQTVIVDRVIPFFDAHGLRIDKILTSAPKV